MDAEREKGEQVLVALLNKSAAAQPLPLGSTAPVVLSSPHLPPPLRALRCVRALRQVPFVRLDCVDGVTALFQEALEWMEGHLDLGDSDEEEEEGERQLSSSGPALSSRGAVAHRAAEEKDSGAGASAILLPPPAATAGRLGLGSGGGAGAGSAGSVAPASLATKLIGSTVTRDYSSPSQSKRSLSGGLGGKRGSLSSLQGASGGSSAASTPPATSPTSGPVSSLQLPSPSASLASASASSPLSSSTSAPPHSASAPKLGLQGLKGQGALSSGHTSTQPSPPSTLPPASTFPSASASSPPSASSTSPSNATASSSPTSGAGAGGLALQGSGGGAGGGVGLGGGGGASSGLGLGGGKGPLGMSLGPSHKPSSRAQFTSAVAGTGGGPSLSDEEKDGGGASGGSAGGGSGGNSGQSSDNDEEVIRVARPLAAKNKLLTRAAGLNSSREFPSPKLGPRSLGTSPAGMGPRGVSAPNNQQTGGGGGGAAAASTSSQLGLSGQSLSARGPVLVHAASVGSAAAVSGGASLQSFLTAPPALASASSVSSDAGDGDSLSLPPLPEPSTELGGFDDSDPSLAGDTSAFILTEPLELGKGHAPLSEKEALGIPEGEAAEEEKDLVDEAMEKRPDPLAKLRNEVIVPVTASPKQFRSSLRLLTLAAESAANADGAAPVQPLTLPGQDEAAGGGDRVEGGGRDEGGAPPVWSSAQRGLHSLSTGVTLSSGVVAAALAGAPSSLSSSSLSPASSASTTPKPAFLRRLDSPESHHGQLIAAKARLQLLINRAVQTIPNLKRDAFPALQLKLEAALAKLEHSTIQP